eukprot:217242-Chlamydomonas_euryale.AAC.5
MACNARSHAERRRAASRNRASCRPRVQPARRSGGHAIREAAAQRARWTHATPERVGSTVSPHAR